LLKDPSVVLPQYKLLLEEDPDVRQELRDTWNAIVASEYANGG